MRVLAAVAVAAALGLLARGATGQEHILIPGQSATGLIESPGEVDEIRLFARQGARVTVTVKAATGSALRPVFTELMAPGQEDLLPSAAVSRSRTGSSVSLKSFPVPKTGTYVLGLSGAQSSTGRYSLRSKAAPSAVVLTGSEGAAIGVAGEEDAIAFEAAESTVLSITVAGIAGGALQPLVVRLDRPDAGGSVDLAEVSRKTSRTKDFLQAVPLPDNGAYGLVVTGASQTTGTYTVAIKPARVPVLDFTVDPSGPPPPPPAPLVLSVDPTSYLIPSAANSMTVTGTGFANGCAVSFAPSADISGLLTTFDSATRLTVTFGVTAGAATGARSVTVTNPDLQSGTLPSAFTLGNAPEDFQVEVTTTSSPQDFIVRFVNPGTLHVDWGDGNTDDYDATLNATHTYVTAGVYTVRMSGYVNGIDFFIFPDPGLGTPELITAIKTPIRGITGLNSAVEMFKHGHNIPSIPAGLFDECPGITSFYDTFLECKKITSIPPGLFDAQTNVTNFYATFDNCDALTSIPPGLFDKHVNNTNFAWTFAKCYSLQSIPDGLFDKHTKVTTFAYVFFRCYSLTSVPPHLFDKNTQVTTYANAFQDCTQLTGETPVNSAGMKLWELSPAPTGSSCFRNCLKLADYDSIPAAWK